MAHTAGGGGLNQYGSGSGGGGGAMMTLGGSNGHGSANHADGGMHMHMMAMMPPSTFSRAGSACMTLSQTDAVARAAELEQTAARLKELLDRMELDVITEQRKRDDAERALRRILTQGVDVYARAGLTWLSSSWPVWLKMLTLPSFTKLLPRIEVAVVGDVSGVMLYALSVTHECDNRRTWDVVKRFSHVVALHDALCREVPLYASSPPQSARSVCAEKRKLIGFSGSSAEARNKIALRRCAMIHEYMACLLTIVEVLASRSLRSFLDMRPEYLNRAVLNGRDLMPRGSSASSAAAMSVRGEEQAGDVLAAQENGMLMNGLASVRQTDRQIDRAASARNSESGNRMFVSSSAGAVDDDVITVRRDNRDLNDDAHVTRRRAYYDDHVDDDHDYDGHTVASSSRQEYGHGRGDVYDDENHPDYDALSTTHNHQYIDAYMHANNQASVETDRHGHEQTRVSHVAAQHNSGGNKDRSVGRMSGGRLSDVPSETLEEAQQRTRDCNNGILHQSQSREDSNRNQSESRDDDGGRDQGGEYVYGVDEATQRLYDDDEEEAVQGRYHFVMSSGGGGESDSDDVLPVMNQDTLQSMDTTCTHESNVSFVCVCM
jgi:hypothetical protein